MVRGEIPSPGATEAVDFQAGSSSLSSLRRKAPKESIHRADEGALGGSDQDWMERRGSSQQKSGG